MQLFSLFQTALELGLICSLTVLALFLSYSMLGVCDLSTDGCFTFGAAVGAVVAAAGYPFLSLPAAMAAGLTSGFVTALLQTKLGVDSLLAGIIVNTGLYSVNIAVMGGSSFLNLNQTDTIFTKARDLLAGTVLEDQSRLLVALISGDAPAAANALAVVNAGLAVRNGDGAVGADLRTHAAADAVGLLHMGLAGVVLLHLACPGAACGAGRLRRLRHVYQDLRPQRHLHYEPQVQH